MPRQFSFRGDRLAYSRGIVLLAAIAFGLLVAFNGDTHALIPLYSVGVFVCFTLSARPGWSGTGSRSASRAGTGGPRSTRSAAILTAIVLVVVVSVKFRDGAYLVVILIPILVGGMLLFIYRQYAASRRHLALRPGPGRHAAPSRGAGRRPHPGPQPGRRPGGQRGPLDQRRRAGGLHLGRPGGRGRDPRRLGAAGLRRSARHRRVAVSRPRRAAPRLPRRARPGLAGGPAGADHVHRGPRVRGPELVGADPLQPGSKRMRAALIGRPQHGRRQRAVPTRGGGPLRPAPAGLGRPTRRRATTRRRSTARARRTPGASG